MDESDVLRDQFQVWRTCDAIDDRPPPLIIETFLDTRSLTNNQSLVTLDGNGKRWDVEESLSRAQADPDLVILERWKIELGEQSNALPVDLGAILPNVYKKSIVLFRSLFTYSRLLPAWNFTKRHGQTRAAPALRIKYRFVDGRAQRRGNAGPDNLTTPLYPDDSKVVDTCRIGTTETPAGTLSAEVTYRTNCEFRVDDSEALLSSRFMGADDEVFRPSIPSRELNEFQSPEIGSLPAGRAMMDYADHTRAYGSLSTFHHVGPPTGTSPISALRAARDTTATSTSPSSSPPMQKLSSARHVLFGGDGGSAFARRPSTSFQPFKAPPLSASPSYLENSLPTRTGPVRTPPGTSDDSKSTSRPSMALTAPRRPAPIPIGQEGSSPRPTSKYSSSFSHRRGRPSFDRVNRTTDDDNNSSGKTSAASSAQPGSGMLADVTGTSADSIQADNENISDFLKLLDQRKDLLNQTDIDASSRKTNAALNRFQRMRESNAVLSDSMSSSLLLRRSSNSSSKHLSGVPPMVGGTSFSTSSSPGKAVSPHTPHTPHTPAIPSRLSANSIIDYNERGEASRHPLSQREQGSPVEEGPAENPERTSSAAAIDIPNSPQPVPYRRSSSAGNRQRISVVDDDDVFPYGLRSVSLGEERSQPSLSTLYRRQEFEGSGANTSHPREGLISSPIDDVPSGSASGGADRGSGPQRGTAATSVPSAGSSSSNHHLYQPRFSHYRGRGSSAGHQSLSPASATVPAHLTDRDNDREYNATGSNSTTEFRRGSGPRSASGRANPQQAASLDEDEPLLFAMSDFGNSRRSLEQGRGHGDLNAGASGSRRGSGRRGVPSYHLWS